MKLDAWEKSTVFFKKSMDIVYILLRNREKMEVAHILYHFAGVTGNGICTVANLQGNVFCKTAARNTAEEGVVFLSVQNSDDFCSFFIRQNSTYIVLSEYKSQGNGLIAFYICCRATTEGEEHQERQNHA